MLGALSAAPLASAEDTVIYATGKEGRGRSRLVGTILDYSGAELRLRQTSGREAAIPSEKVLSVEFTKGKKHLEAESAFESAEYSKGIDLFREALREERREWVQRQILAQTVWCHRNLGQIERAGDIFLILFENDPATLHFDAIPLAWSGSAAPPAVERHARNWLAKDSPAAALLGASWLLSTDRTAATAALSRLAESKDFRIASLAAAQLWRARLVTAKPEEVARWQEAAGNLAQPLRAGPYFVVAEALARLGEPEQAALAYLRAPLLYPRHRYLAADALFGAGRQLEALERKTEAASVYRELLAEFPTAQRSAEAQRRLEELEKN